MRTAVASQAISQEHAHDAHTHTSHIMELATSGVRPGCEMQRVWSVLIEKQ